MQMKSMLKYVKVGLVFAKGILGFRKKQYRLSFVHDTKDNMWYIDMPWPGDRHNLAMVSGSNKLLDFLCEEEDDNYVTVDVLPRNKQEKHVGYFVCEQTEASLFGGSFYEVKGLEGFAREIWICPVTLCVLGHYPKYLYIRKISSKDKAEEKVAYAQAKKEINEVLEANDEFERTGEASTLDEVVARSHQRHPWLK